MTIRTPVLILPILYLGLSSSTALATRPDLNSDPVSFGEAGHAESREDSLTKPILFSTPTLNFPEQFSQLLPQTLPQTFSQHRSNKLTNSLPKTRLEASESVTFSLASADLNSRTQTVAGVADDDTFSGAWSSEWREITWRSVGQDASAPFQLGVSHEAAWVLAGGAGATGLALAYESWSDQHFQNWMTTHHPLGGASRAGDIWGQTLPNILYAGGMLSEAAFANSGVAKRLAIRRAHMMFEATFWAAAFSTVFKYTVREERPDHSTRDSFPSGHATTAFAFASVVAQEHAWYWGGAAYASAAFTGLSRINDNRHYLHDVLAGAAIGTAFGIGITQIFKFREEPLLNSASAESVVESGESKQKQNDATRLGISPLDGRGYLVTATASF